MSVSHRKTVPFSKGFAIEWEQFPCAFLYFGSSAWEAKKDMNSRTMLLPPFEKPQDYEWRMLKGCKVFGWELGNSDLEYRKRLAYEILKAGALSVEFILHERLEEFIACGHTMLNRIKPHERYIR